MTAAGSPVPSAALSLQLTIATAPARQTGEAERARAERRSEEEPTVMAPWDRPVPYNLAQSGRRLRLSED